MIIIRFIALLWFVVFTFNSVAETSVVDVGAHQTLKDSFIKHYNASDFKALYSKASEPYKQRIDEQEFVVWLQESRNRSGAIKSSQLTDDLSSVKYFSLEGEQQTVRLELSAASATQFNDANLVVLNRNSGSVLASSNPRRSALEKQVDTALQNLSRDPRTVGFSVGIYYQKKSYLFHYGTTEYGKAILPTNNTRYEIASISKTFTGTLLAQAVVEKKLTLEDDVRSYLAGDYNNLVFDGEPIRIKHLLNHRSGLPLIFPDDPMIFADQNYEQIPYRIIAARTGYTRERFLTDLRAFKLTAKPGSQFRYSNVSADLAALILEQLYQKPFTQLLSEKLFVPLGMKNSELQVAQVEHPQLAFGYNEKAKVMPRNIGIIGADGSIRTTAEDLLRYLRYHLDERDPAVGVSHTVTYGALPRYAVGLNWQMKTDWRNTRQLWQSGGSFGFSSYATLYPEQGLAIAILSNESDPQAQQRLESAAREIYHRLR